MRRPSTPVPTSRTPYIALALGSCLVFPALAEGLAPRSGPALGNDSHVRVAWYADGSCLLRIDEHDLVGVTGIDADMGPEGARTMLHCDADTGQRMTVLARGDGLEIGERVVLADPAEIESNVNGSVAWLALLDDDVLPENTPRRFIVEGRILIRETPGVEVAGAATHADKLPFAEIAGRLEPLKRHPDPQEPGALSETVDPEGVTRMACRVRPCAPTNGSPSSEGEPGEPAKALETIEPTGAEAEVDDDAATDVETDGGADVEPAPVVPVPGPSVE